MSVLRWCVLTRETQMDSGSEGLFEQILVVGFLGCKVFEDLYEELDVVNFPIEVRAFHFTSEKFGKEVLFDQRGFC